MTRNEEDFINSLLDDHANIVVGHDAVHPSRTECGGIGGCRMLRTEHQVETEIIETLTAVARGTCRARVQLR